jgi:RimJ/RimL family protein N-acetyltransferase
VLTGRAVTLRALREDDLPTLYAWDQDLEITLLRSPGAPTPATFEQFREFIGKPDDTAVHFAVEVDGRLVGDAGLWGIDRHNRAASLGVAIGEASERGRGFGRDAVEVLTDYGLRLLGLHRIEIQTLVGNTAMRRTAESIGYRQEGVRRELSWIAGEWVDEVVYGLLAHEWKALR